MKLKNKIEKLSNEVMTTLGPGYKENVYELALAHDLRLNGIPYERQTNIEITYKGYYLKDVLSDIIIDDKILIELKAVKNIKKRHRRQAQVYMFSLNLDEGMVISFSSDGEVLREDIEIPELREPSEKVIPIFKDRTYDTMHEILEESVEEIMNRFGTEFMFTDAKFDMYIRALAVDLQLRGINFRKAESPVLYKSLEVDRKELEFLLDDGTGIYPFSYKKEEEIEEETQEVEKIREIMNLDKIWMVSFPKKEELEPRVDTVEK